MTEFSHLDEKGQARMVDVSRKAPTLREAVASGKVLMKPATVKAIKGGGIAKGDVFAVARVAGIMAAKKAGNLIPLCHPLEITGVEVSFATEAARGEVAIQAKVRTVGKTGVEMEALTAVSVAALTIYDMCKSADRGIVISDILLVRKSGGRSGTYDIQGRPETGKRKA